MLTHINLSQLQRAAFQAQKKREPKLPFFLQP